MSKSLSTVDDDTRIGTGSCSTAENDSHSEYRIPSRAIFCENDLKLFQKSQTHRELVAFIKLLNQSVMETKVSDAKSTSPLISDLENYMESLYSMVDEVPPLNQPMRFGNKAFTQWHQLLVERAPERILAILPADKRGAALELVPYLTSAFGDPRRIDYGTGHETNFVVFLCCFFKLDLFSQKDLPAVVLRVFVTYLRVMRRLQTDYVLEPAGSHGVWGLDDYQCLPFYWGAAQLCGEQSFRPTCIENDEVLETHGKDYLYFAAIRFIKEVKAGVPFAESSPMLYDISGVPNWEKVNSGMMKLYLNEVLGKLPVIQHFKFGSILPPPKGTSGGPPQQGEAAAAAAGSSMGRAPWARPGAGGGAGMGGVGGGGDGDGTLGDGGCCCSVSCSCSYFYFYRDHWWGRAAQPTCAA